MIPSIAYGIAGLIGSGLKAFVSTDQANISKKSVADVVIGGAVGILYPLFPFVPIPDTASLLQQAVMIGVISYFSSDLVTGILSKLGIGPSTASMTTGQLPTPPTK
jgi:VIT1/CCC1 family predicted Fe2+/Mn2+ transporter